MAPPGCSAGPVEAWAPLTLAAGLAGVVLVRPHLGLIVLAGLVLGYAFTIARRRSMLAPVGWIVGLAVLAVTAVILVAQASSFLGVENLTQESVDQKLSSVEKQTGQGGSEFNPVAVNNPLDVPGATLTVLFRPLPFEAHSPFVAATSLEGLLLIGLCVTSWRRLRSIPALMRSSPYVAYSIGFVLAFVIAFSRFGNFGILARERSQVLPALLVLLALPVTARARRTRRGADHRQARPRLTCRRRPSGSVTHAVTGSWPFPLPFVPVSGGVSAGGFAVAFGALWPYP